jgi:hypothetical protein
VYGDGKSYTAEYWQYDSRLGRRWNVDPVIKPSLSGFSTFANNPISFKDFYGLDSIFYKKDGSYEIRKGGKEWYIHGELAEFVVRDVHNPYRFGSSLWRAVENNRNNPNLWNNRSIFRYNRSTSPWQKEFNKAFGWMITTTFLGVALPEFGGDLLGFSIEATPEIMGSIKTGTAFLKYQSARAIIYGNRICTTVNSNILFAQTYYTSAIIMGYPLYKTGAYVTLVSLGIVGYHLYKFNILPYDYLTGITPIDLGLGFGQIFHYLRDELKTNKNEKNEEKQD